MITLQNETYLLNSLSACSMCIQNLRREIVNNSYNVNETSIKVMALRDLTDFNEPMVDVSHSLQQAKVGDVLRQLPN